MSLLPLVSSTVTAGIIFVGAAGMVAQEVMPQDEIVDFVKVSPNEDGVSQYLLQETEPFYKKSP